MIPEALRARAARHGLVRHDQGWRRPAPAECRVAGFDPVTGEWWWRPDDTLTSDAVLCGSEAEALSAALDWLDAQAPENTPRNLALEPGPADDVLLAHPEHAEAAVGRWLAANPEAFLRLATEGRVALAWTPEGVAGARYRWAAIPRAGVWAGRVLYRPTKGDYFWQAQWSNVGDGPVPINSGEADSERAGMVRIDEALAAHGVALVGGAAVAADEAEREPEACPVCDGSGWVFPPEQQRQPCPHCEPEPEAEHVWGEEQIPQPHIHSLRACTRCGLVRRSRDGGWTYYRDGQPVGGVAEAGPCEPTREGR